MPHTQTPTSQISTDTKRLIKKASLQTLLDSIAEGVIILDASLHIYYINTFAEKLTGKLHQNVLNKGINDVLELHCTKQNAIIPWPLETVLKNGEDKSYECDYLQLEGDKVIPIEFHPAPVKSDDGEIIGVMLIFRDITEEKELIRLKSEFVSIVSHQLRTPASAVKWYLETLIDNRHGYPMNEWQDDKLHESYQSNERMIHLINDLLNVSRLDSGRYQLNVTSFSVSELLDEICKELTHFSHAHNVVIKNAIAADVSNVEGDRDKIREVLLNMLTNAIKYTTTGHQEIIVGASTIEHGLVQFSIKDHGIGIPKKDLEHIFKKFYRADNAIESQTEGSGLGLYIAREIARLHGGDMRIESKEGEGTTVFVTLPVKYSQ